MFGTDCCTAVVATTSPLGMRAGLQGTAMPFSTGCCCCRLKQENRNSGGCACDDDRCIERRFRFAGFWNEISCSLQQHRSADLRASALPCRNSTMPVTAVCPFGTPITRSSFFSPCDPCPTRRLRRLAAFWDKWLELLDCGCVDVTRPIFPLQVFKMCILVGAAGLCRRKASPSVAPVRMLESFDSWLPPLLSRPNRCSLRTTRLSRRTVLACLCLQY